jgi:hypothetical protein
LLVASLEVVEPTLDDVFVAKTGHHLEGSGDGAVAGSGAAGGPAPDTGEGRNGVAGVAPAAETA